MGKLNIYILYFGMVIFSMINGQITSDPAPGRSPGPPTTTIISTTTNNNKNNSKHYHHQHHFEQHQTTERSKNSRNQLNNNFNRSHSINNGATITARNSFSAEKDDLEKFNIENTSNNNENFEQEENGGNEKHQKFDEISNNENSKRISKRKDDDDDDNDDESGKSSNFQEKMIRPYKKSDLVMESTSFSDATLTTTTTAGQFLKGNSTYERITENHDADNYSISNSSSHNKASNFSDISSSSDTHGSSNTMNSFQKPIVVMKKDNIHNNKEDDDYSVSNNKVNYDNDKNDNTSSVLTNSFCKIHLNNYLRSDEKIITLKDKILNDDTDSEGDDSRKSKFENDEYDTTAENNVGNNEKSSSFVQVIDNNDVKLVLLHDVFDVQNGITCGLMYKVTLKLSSKINIKDFFMETLIKGKEKGNFVREHSSSSSNSGSGNSSTINKLPVTSLFKIPSFISDGIDTAGAGGDEISEIKDWPSENTNTNSNNNNFIKVNNNKNNNNQQQKQQHTFLYSNDDDDDDDNNKNVLEPIDRWAEQDNFFTNDEDNLSAGNGCNTNKWSHIDVNKNKEINMFWMLNEFCESVDDTVVEFRLFFRVKTNKTSTYDDGGGSERNQRIVYKKSFFIRINKDCQLYLHKMSGVLEYTSLPLHATDCSIYFPSQINKVSSSSSSSSSSSPSMKSPGILVELIRLNIPCHSGGYIKFSNNSPLCGKLEELNLNERTYHFDIINNNKNSNNNYNDNDNLNNYSNNFSIRIFNKPMFSLKYQIVDYCYNMTLFNRNGTFFIQPFREILQCYFKIHLPYGNRIDLNLITNIKASELNNFNNSYDRNRNTNNNYNYENSNINSNFYNYNDNDNENQSDINTNEAIYNSHSNNNYDLIDLNKKIKYTAHIDLSSNSNNFNNNLKNLKNSSISNSHNYKKLNSGNSSNITNGKIINNGRGNNGDKRKNYDDSTTINNNNAIFDCRDNGILIRIFETKLYKWSYCIRNLNDTKLFTLTSQGNIIIIQVIMKLFKSSSLSNNDSHNSNSQNQYHATTMDEHYLRSSSISQPSSLSSGNLKSSFTSSTSTAQEEQQHHHEQNQQQMPSLYFTYTAKSIPEIVSKCAFGWIAVGQLCISLVQKPMTWHEGEQYCVNKGGHLASIRSESEQKLVDQLLINSPGYQDHFAYWVGASDLSYEGDFRWSDGIPFHYAHWFPGWPQHAHYNKQPNDDGLSGQDCIELRRYFRAPPGIQLTDQILTNTFMWNDRDCNAKNFLICERSMMNEASPNNWTNDCNKTITLSNSNPKSSLWSPSFPRQYPDNANCYTTIIAPAGYRIVLEFEELVIENEPGCSYDYIEIIEPQNNYARKSNNLTRIPRHSRRNGNNFPNSYENFSFNNNNIEFTHDLMTTTSASTMTSTNYQNLLNIFSNLYNKPWSNILIQTPTYPHGKTLYKTNKPQELPRRMCGDWSSKLKLLRYTSSGSYLGIHFVSDYSHHYGGYKAKVYMENAISDCPDDKLKPYNGSCYLFVHYPTVDWFTAQHVCRGIDAELSSVLTPDEHRFITTSIRNDLEYSPQRIYWLGAELGDNKHYMWSDDAAMSFQGWLPGQGTFDKKQGEMICLGLHWKMSPTPMLPSGLYWESQKCSNTGGYVCKKPKQIFDQLKIKNETVTGSEGRLTSPGYPKPYPLSIDYWVKIISPERTRIIVQFQKIDLESQDECLYDYIIVQNYETISEISLEPGTNTIPMAMLIADKDLEDLQYRNERILYSRRIRSIEPKSFNPQQQQNLLSSSSSALKNQREKIKLQKYHHRQHDYYAKNNNIDSKSVIDSTMYKLLPSSLQNKRFNRKHRYRKKSIINFKRKLQNNLSNSRNSSKRKRKKRHIIETSIEDTIVDVDNAQSFLPYVRWCGSHDSNMSKFDFISSSNEVILNFHSDYSISGNGFAATWKAIDISGCPLQTLTSREGIISSPNYPHFLINNLDCTYVIQAPAIGNKVWLEFKDFDITDDTIVFLDIGYGPFIPFQNDRHINEGVFISIKEHIKVQIKTGQKPRGRGFQVYFKTVWSLQNERIIHLSNDTAGYLYHLNYPQKIPAGVEFTQHFMVPLGENILLELYGVEFSENGCPDNNVLEVYDNYADKNGTKWNLCKYQNSKPQSPVQMTSFLNTIHIRQKTVSESHINLNASIRVQHDLVYKSKLENDETVESCVPNPCQSEGKCVLTNERISKCQCPGHFTGRFCGLNMCELQPCLFGKCELTPLNFKCHCQAGYIGRLCEQKKKPCAENPCEGRGECFEKNGGFFCRCHAWWEGQRCERRMIHIPYKPLSERMLQEPFWLGLITVFVVLAIIGLIWCAKRHFPEKIEKLLAEEAERNRPPNVGHHHHTSLREQLQFTTSIPQATIVTPGAPRSIFNRLGIRKPSILSLSSPNPPGGATARTFSLDDLLRPPPRRSPSPRKKRNNSTPTKKNATEKKQILQQLVSPAANQTRPKISLGELIQMSENRLKSSAATSSEGDLKETNFSETSTTNSASASTLVRPLTDPKLEKKVTFARLLSKVSAEMSSESGENDIYTRNSSALSLPTEIQYLPNSLPQSPCTNDLRSPHSISSNHESNSLSSSELALSDMCLKASVSAALNANNRRSIRPKVSSADSILAMFRCQTIASSTPLQTSSLFVSPSTTPTASSPQDDVLGDDESSTSSMHTPVSFSSGAPDSPIFYRQTTIEIPVIDALNAHKNASTSSSSSSLNTNLLHPPTVLLEIPSNGINKCLSPIRELPTPIPSPALTPIMPRPNRSNSPLLQDDPFSGSYSDDEDKSEELTESITCEINREMSRMESEVESASPTSVAGSNKTASPKLNLMPMPTSIIIDIEPPTPEREERAQRPKNLVIPTLMVEQASPTKDRLPMIVFPGSPPPQRASIGETSFMFPNKQQQKRLLKQYEKPTSLDLSFTPPMITVTSNISELESDIESVSPAPTKVAGPAPLLAPVNQVGMCYLSPFAICSRADRTISESNLSSSGYSSMASPGPSRCGSSNPLFSNEVEDPGCGPSGSNFSLGVNLFARRQSATLPVCKENILSEKSVSNESPSRTHERVRGRSDSETLSDDPLLESNDEGIGTDHLDDKTDDADEKKKIKAIIEVSITEDSPETVKSVSNVEDTTVMSQLQLPSIVIQSSEDGKLSPVSSRSESPLSERAGGMGRFSPQFYGRKDQQLPFTDSDGLYDFPSSDSKGTVIMHQRRSSSKKRERKLPKTSSQLQSPIKNVNLDLPSKETSASVGQQQNSTLSRYHHHYYDRHVTTTRKSPKRRPIQRYPVASSSSSSESLTPTKEYTVKTSPIKNFYLKDCSADENNEEDSSNQILPASYCSGLSKPRISRLRAISNQIRFLRRLEKSIKKREQEMSSLDSYPDDYTDDTDSTRVTSPLLQQNNVKNRTSICQQKRMPSNSQKITDQGWLSPGRTTVVPDEY